MVEISNFAVGPVWGQEKEAVLRPCKRQHGSSHPLCEWRKGRGVCVCVCVKDVWEKGQDPLQCESLRHYLVQEYYMWYLIGFLVVLLLSEDLIRQIQGKAMIPEFLLELRQLLPVPIRCQLPGRALNLKNIT